MKKTTIVLALLLGGLHFSAYAQNARVGVSGGFTISDIRGQINQMNHAVKTGAVLGLVLDIPINSRLTFQPAVNYVQKGNVQQENSQTKTRIALRYAEIPFNFLYSFGANNTGLYAGAGPSLAFNVPSKRIVETKKSGVKTTTDILFGETAASDLRGIDYGANFQLGYKLPGGIFFSTFYNLGLRNLAPGEDPAGIIKNSCFGIQVGALIKNK